MREVGRRKEYPRQGGRVQKPLVAEKNVWPQKPQGTARGTATENKGVMEGSMA